MVMDDNGSFCSEYFINTESYLNVGFRTEVCARDVNLGVINTKMVFKAIRFDEITI